MLFIAGTEADQIKGRSKSKGKDNRNERQSDYIKNINRLLYQPVFEEFASRGFFLLTLTDTIVSLSTVIVVLIPNLLALFVELIVIIMTFLNKYFIINQLHGAHILAKHFLLPPVFEIFASRVVASFIITNKQVIFEIVIVFLIPIVLALFLILKVIIAAVLKRGQIFIIDPFGGAYISFDIARSFFFCFWPEKVVFASWLVRSFFVTTDALVIYLIVSIVKIPQCLTLRSELIVIIAAIIKKALSFIIDPLGKALFSLFNWFTIVRARFFFHQPVGEVLASGVVRSLFETEILLSFNFVFVTKVDEPKWLTSILDLIIIIAAFFKKVEATKISPTCWAFTYLIRVVRRDFIASLCFSLSSINQYLHFIKLISSRRSNVIIEDTKLLKPFCSCIMILLVYF